MLADLIAVQIKILKLVQHPNVVNLVEVLASPTKMYLVQELITGGELFWLIRTWREHVVPLSWRFLQ